MHDRRNVGQEECRTRGMQDSRNVRQDECITGEMPPLIITILFVSVEPIDISPQSGDAGSLND